MKQLSSRRPGWPTRALLFALCWMISMQSAALESGPQVVVPPPGEHRYTCSMPLVGDQAAYANLTFDASAGNEQVEPVTLDGTLTFSEDTRTVLQFAGADTLEGTAAFSMLAIQGQLEKPVALPVTLSRAEQIADGGGPIVLEMAGALPALPVEQAGSIVEFILDKPLELTLTAKNDRGELTPEPLGEFVVRCVAGYGPVDPLEPDPTEAFSDFFEVTPTSFSFGYALVGEQIKKTVKLTNKSPEARQAPAMTLSGDDVFELVSQCPAMLASGESCTLDVIFSPIVSGASTANLLLAHYYTALDLLVYGRGENHGIALDIRPLDALRFGTLVIGEEATKPYTLTNPYMPQQPLPDISITGEGDFFLDHNCPPMLATGESCTLDVTLRPLEVGHHLAQLNLTSPDGKVRRSLFGRGDVLEVSPQEIGFGRVQVPFRENVPAEELATETITLTNLYLDQRPVPGISIENNTGAFSQTNRCPPMLGPQESCTVDVSYQPSDATRDGATLILSTTAGDMAVPLSGTGTVPMSFFRIDTHELDFGDVPIGQQDKATLTLTNIGHLELPAPSASVPDRSPYALVNLCPARLSPGDSCTLDIFFNPFDEQVRDEEITISTSGGRHKIPLPGRGFIKQASGYHFSRTDHLSCSFGHITIGATVTTSVSESQTEDGTGTPLILNTRVRIPGDAAWFLGASSSAGQDRLEGTGRLQISTDEGEVSTLLTMPLQQLSTDMGPVTIEHSETVPRASVGESLRFGFGALRLNLTGLPPVDAPAHAPSRQFTGDCTPSNYLVRFGRTDVNPHQVDFGYVLDGDAATRTIALGSRYNPANPAEFELAGPDAGAFTYVNRCVDSDSRSTPCAVEVTYAPTEPGIDQAMLRIEMEPSGQGRIVEIPLSGTSVESLAPTLAASPGAVDFGALGSGATAERTFAVSNMGNVATAIRDITIDGPGASSFQQSHRCTVLGAGERCEVRVTATAADTGFAEAYVRVVPEHLDAKSISVPLRAALQSEQCLSVGFGVTGSTDMNGPVELDGALYATRNCDERRFSGLLELAPTRTTVPILGLLWSGWPGTAHLEFEAVDEISGTLAEDGSMATAESRFHIVVPRITAKIFGRDRVIGGGSRCRTADPVTLNLTGSGRELYGRFSIGYFENCGLTTGLLNRYLSGSSGETRLTLMPVD